MKEIGLGARLQGVADYVPKGARIADIGTDHAYLPIYLILSGRIQEAVGIDVHEGPYQSALGTVKSYGLASRIQIRLGDGLSPLKEGEADTLILAGMGGNTMLEILEARPEILKDIQQIITQPQGAQAKLRKEMLAQGWFLQDERMVMDERRLYMIINFSKAEGQSLAHLQISYQQFWTELNPYLLNDDPETISLVAYNYFWSLGPILINKKEPLLKLYIEDLINGLDQRIEQMKRSHRSEVQNERANLLNEKIFLEGLQQWLFQLD